jgi:glycerol-3-phosphate dehydrogenase
MANNTPDKMTEQEVRRIAREESMQVFEKSIATVTKQIEEIKMVSKQNQSTLGRLERLLLGEMGTDKDDTLKARATFAYQYAKRNTELKIVERAIPALLWFEDWNTPEMGSKESKMQSLCKLVTFYNNIRWFLALLGITTLINAVPAIKLILEFFESKL